MEEQKRGDVLNAPGGDGTAPHEQRDSPSTERPSATANRKRGEAVAVEGTMPWMGPEEIKELEHVQKIRNAIVESEGLMTPELNQRALGYVTHYYERAIERAAKAKAMQDEYFSKLLLDDPDMSIGRAKAIAGGSEFGQKHTCYKNQAEGYKEIMQSLKKNIAYYEGKARNQW